MIEHIIIPTLGRMDKQLTYNALPQKYQDITKFVVQAHEFEEMKSRYGDKVLCLPIFPTMTDRQIDYVVSSLK